MTSGGPHALPAAACVVGVLFWAQLGRADPPVNAPVHVEAVLDYAVPSDAPACPDRDAFTSAVATRLGYDPMVAKEARATGTKTLSVQFVRENKAIRAALRLSNAQKEIEAEKALVSETGACAELGAAAAFAAAIMLDPRAMFPRPKAQLAPGAPPAGASLDSRSAGTWPWYERPPSVPPPVVPRPAEPAPTPWQWRAGLGVVGCAGCAPAVNIGAMVFVGVTMRRLGLDLGVRADVPASADAPSGRSVSSSLVVGELFPHARFGLLRLGVLGSAGALFGQSSGENQVSMWAAAGARAAVEWPIARPVFLRAALDGQILLSRVSLRVEGSELWSSPAFAAAASLGAGLDF